MLKKIPLFVFTGFAFTFSFAQDKIKTSGNGFEFEVLYDVEKLDVENQYRSSTCWSFSSNSFLESEMIRMGKDPVDISEMFIVWNTYMDKAEKYVRMHGNFNFGPGGAFHDVMYVGKNYGLVPEEVYPGTFEGEDKPMHSEMDKMLKAMVKVVVKNPNGELSPAWKNAVGGVLDAYLGDKPEEFKYKGKKYTPKSFASSLGINFDDYIEIGSYTHHPFYEKFILEVPDNWMLDEIYNVPLSDLKDIMRNALENGYSFGWGADVSEKGFSWGNAVAVVPQGGWEDVERSGLDSILTNPVPQMEVTQESRQKQFDNYETQDDHGMHITGLAKDENNTLYYIVKNSWGTGNDADGYLYASESYVLLKTIDIIIHKDALTAQVKRKLGIN